MQPYSMLLDIEVTRPFICNILVKRVYLNGTSLIGCRGVPIFALLRTVSAKCTCICQVKHQGRCVL